MDEDKKEKRRQRLSVVFKIAVVVAAVFFIGYTVYYFCTFGKQVDRIKDRYEVITQADGEQPSA